MKSVMIYLVTRTHGLHAHLLTREHYDILARARDLNALIENLLKSDYGPEIGKISSEAANASALNRIFYSILVSRIYFVAKIAPNRIRKFLVTYADRYEVENVKRILRSKRTGRKMTSDTLIPIPREYALINFQAMIEAPTLEDSLDLLKATRYSEVSEKISIYKKHEVQAVLEALIDKIYFDQLLDSIDGIPDEEKVKEIVGAEIDLRNIGTMIDLKARGVSPEAILATSFKSFRLKEEDKNQIATARIESVPDIVARTTYQGFASNLKSIIEENRIEQLENAILKEAYAKAKSISGRNPNSFTYVIGYLAAAEMETRNLITLSTAKELKIEEEKVRNLLYL